MSLERKGRLFGTDGVRGHANCYPMTVETALALGRAIGALFKRREGKHRIVVGKDTRLSCYMFENALIAGLCSMGVDTLMVGPLPTPGVAFIIKAYRADAGIVISASHNPYCDNGIKIFTADGFKLPDEVEAELEEMVRSNHFQDFLPPDDAIGRNSRIGDADGRYIEFVKATFPRSLSLKDKTIVLDCANGAAHRVAPLVFRELDARVFDYCTSPNGLNINLHCGALHPEIIQKAVIDHHAEVGIALDGDGDRAILVDENAQIVDGDTLLAICAADMKRRGVLHNHCVVATAMSNLGFLKSMKEMGIDVKVTQVGDRYVIQEMLKSGANLGGEQSGHLIFLDHNTTADGLVTALQVLRIMIETDSKLSDLAALVQRYPQVLVNVRVRHKLPLEQIEGFAETLQQIEQSLGESGRVLVRYSGTENVCRIMVEAPKHKLASSLAAQLQQVVEKKIGLGALSD